MLNKYKKSSTTLHAFSVMREMKTLKKELHEHRYYLERNVAKQTEYLTRRIDLLEFCNATLCAKLAISKKELAELHATEKESAPGERSLLNTDMRRIVAV